MLPNKNINKASQLSNSKNTIPEIVQLGIKHLERRQQTKTHSSLVPQFDTLIYYFSSSFYYFPIYYGRTMLPRIVCE